MKGYSPKHSPIFGMLSFRQNVFTSTKCLFGKLSLGKMSLRQMSFGKISGNRFISSYCMVQVVMLEGFCLNAINMIKIMVRKLPLLNFRL